MGVSKADLEALKKVSPTTQTMTYTQVYQQHNKIFIYSLNTPN